jgi:hypothetical protein
MSQDYARDASLSPEQENRIRAELQQGENLVWAGRPRPDLMMRSAFFLVPFGLVFGGFAAFWIVMASTIVGKAANVGGPAVFDFFPLCGLPFLLVGLFMVSSPYWLRRKAQRTLYALTNQRALIWEPGFFGSFTLRNYTAAGLGRMSRTERADGSGDLVFEEFVTYGANSQGHRTASTTRRGFLGINDVRKVEELVRLTLLS